MNTPPQHHAFGTPQSAAHFCSPRRSPEAERKAISRPLVKGGGGVVPTVLQSLEDAAAWLTEVEGYPCVPSTKSIGRAMAEYVAYRIEKEREYLQRMGGHT